MYYIYILENNEKTLLFIGCTTDLKQVLKERRNGNVHLVECSNLVYYELSDSEKHATEREKAIKAMTRKERASLIKAFNPEEIDLSSEL